MTYLVDANILLRLCDTSHPHHAVAKNAVATLQARGDVLQVPQQSLYEFWTVATRPKEKNGLGLSPQGATAFLTVWERMFSALPEQPLYSSWRALVTGYSVKGKQGHDARLVAAMKVHGLTHILTFNGSDFHRYAPEGIVVVDPQTI